MKKVIFIMITFIVVFTAGCKSASSPFSEVMDIEWKLTEIRTGGNYDINFDRGTLVSEGFPDIFTLTFTKEEFRGKGAPNTISASFAVGKNFDISLQPINISKMEVLTRPEKLKEHDFVTFIQNIYGWKLADEKLELTTKGESGGEIKMVFVK